MTSNDKYKSKEPPKQKFLLKATQTQTFLVQMLHKQFPRRRSRNFNICVNNRTNTRCAPPALQYKQSSKQSRKQSHKQSFRAIEPKDKQTLDSDTPLDTTPARPPFSPRLSTPLPRAHPSHHDSRHRSRAPATHLDISRSLATILSQTQTKIEN